MRNDERGDQEDPVEEQRKAIDGEGPLERGHLGCRFGEDRSAAATVRSPPKASRRTRRPATGTCGASDVEDQVSNSKMAQPNSASIDGRDQDEMIP